MGGTADECYMLVSGAGRRDDFRMSAFIVLRCYKVGIQSYITIICYTSLWNGMEFE